MKNSPLIRICPANNGTFAATRWNSKTEDYEPCSPMLAVQILAQHGAHVEVAVNDPYDPHSNYECRASMKRI